MDMFEQSVLIDHNSNKSWTVFVSLMAQVLLVSAVVAVPLIFTDHLPPFQWVATTITVPAPLPPPPAVVREDRSIQRATDAPSRAPRVFVAPSHVPDRIDTTPDTAAPAAPSLPQIGVQFSTGTNTGSAMFDNAIARVATPPPPLAVRKPEKPSGPIPVGGRVQAARLTKQVVPAYPALAKTARISGTVRLQGIIGKDGAIKNVQLISGHPLLVQAALEAVRQWVYKPTLLNGEAVELIAPIDVIFTLNQ